MSKNTMNSNQASLLPADESAIVGSRGQSSTSSSASTPAFPVSTSSRRGQSTAVSGGFDVTSAEMPGTQTPGRREPVRGDTSQSTTTTSSSSSSSSSPLHPSSPSSARNPRSAGASAPAQPGEYEMRTQNSSRLEATSRTTRPRVALTPAGAVPIANRASAAYFPPSPPSTVASADSPPASPSAEFGSMHLIDEPILEESYAESQENARWWAGAEGSRQETGEDTAEQWGKGGNSGSGPESRITPATGPSLQSFAQRQKAAASHSSGPYPTTSDMPDTPRQTPTAVSPAVVGYAHHPTASGQRFFCSLFEDFPLQKGAEHVVGTASDAGVDLACEGWSGAVLDQSRLASHAHSSAGPLSNNATGRALFTLLPAAAQAERLREEVLSILDLASEELKCDVVFMAVDRIGMEESDWKAILHGLCYVGGSVVATGGLKGNAGKEKLTGCKVREGMVLVAVEM